MSGHSKWATIHRAKESKDAKKGAVFTKMAANIMVAVRQGGGIGDPEKNFRLRLAVDKARQFNMPKENINRAIEKGMGVSGGAEMTDLMYEGFSPGGCALIVEALTDNKARTYQQVRTAMEKSGGVVGSSGSVNYMFSQKGELRVKIKPGSSKDEQELELIDMGIDDLDDEGDNFDVYCDKDKTFEIKEKITAAGFEVESAELTMKPEAWIEIKEPEIQQRVEALLEQLEGIDDVTHVWTNYQPV